MWCTSCANCCDSENTESVVDRNVPALGLPANEDLFTATQEVSTPRVVSAMRAKEKTNAPVAKTPPKPEFKQVPRPVKQPPPKPPVKVIKEPPAKIPLMPPPMKVTRVPAGKPKKPPPAKPPPAKPPEAPPAEAPAKPAAAPAKPAAAPAKPAAAPARKPTIPVVPIDSKESSETDEKPAESPKAEVEEVPAAKPVEEPQLQRAPTLDELPTEVGDLRQFSSMTEVEQAMVKNSLESVMKNFALSACVGIPCWLLQNPENLPSAIRTASQIPDNLKEEKLFKMDRLLQTVTIMPKAAGTEENGIREFPLQKISDIWKGGQLKEKFAVISDTLSMFLLGIERIEPGDFIVLAFKRVSDCETVQLSIRLLWTSFKKDELLASAGTVTTGNNEGGVSVESDSVGQKKVLERLKKENPMAAQLATALNSRQASLQPP